MFFFFLGWVSWGPNLWGNAQYPHIWEQQRIRPRRFTFVRFKRLRLVVGCRPVGGGRGCRRRQAREADPREEAHHARRKRTWSANCVQGLIMWKQNLGEWFFCFVFLWVVSQALWDASRMKEMRLILAIAWLFVCLFVFFTCRRRQNCWCLWRNFSPEVTHPVDGWCSVYMKTRCVHYLNRKLVDSPRMWKLCHRENVPPWYACQSPI